jgi:hypothetical protein
VFPEWNHTAEFNATVAETCRRRELAQRDAESARAITTRSVSYMRKPDIGELADDFMGGTPTPPLRPTTSTTQEIPQTIRQPLYQYEALHIDIYARYAATFIGPKGRNCKFWINKVRGVSDIFVLGHPATQGTRTVAVISWHPGGQVARERVRNLINDFNARIDIRTGYPDGRCEWLDAPLRAWLRERRCLKREPGGGVQKTKQRGRRERGVSEQKQDELNRADAVDFYGLV